MKKENKYFANLNEEKTVEMLPNLFRTTLAIIKPSYFHVSTNS